ncbi:hypothetical protein [Fischerella thermalis]|uniref:Uncharacterized protein n=1 Tax=Fischerella thermalis CCMEE 5318 TaxID=2019666 RepID=A0A2N6LJJ1_9CYAN|nr:hypothetical protein [Fischerella thermalis]PMB24751.1 hypothetical protein CEN46_07250 [Fischerella thermalis CCMEE 5318]PMB36531.1 hypothetical protein CEN47_08440 [Fischerella thermalis CCMEE 5319]
MDCKYKDHPFPPCRFEQHPRNPNIYFCPHCRESYDVREVGNKFPTWLLLMIAIVILMIVAGNPKSLQETEENIPTPNPSQLE